MPPAQDVEKKLLGTVLVEAGLITPEQLNTALEEQKEHGGRLGFNLVRLGFIAPLRLAQFLQENFGVGVLPEGLRQRQQAAEALPRHLALYYKIAPIKLEANTLTVAVAEIAHSNLIQALSDVTGYQIDPLIYPEERIRSLVDGCYQIPTEHGVDLFPSGDNAFVLVDTQRQIKALSFSQLKNERDAGEWLRSIIAEAIKEKSREILIQPESEGASVLLRKESFYPSEFSLTPDLQDDLTFLLFRLSRMNPIEPHKAQHGRFQVKIQDRKISMVVRAFPTIYGTRFFLEMFDEKLLKHSFDEQILPYPDLRELLESFLIRGNHGLCVITGPDGSGRGSFLYSLLSRCKEKFHQILTLENSVRYPLSGITQSEVEEAEMEAVLENVMKQKPDLVAVSVLRTVRSAELAFLVAARVPVIAVMPSYDSFVALEWFSRHNLKSAIKAGLLRTILSPRLLIRACPNCSIPSELTDEERIALKVPAEAPLRMNQGCDFCLDSAEEASEVIFEFLKIDPEVISWVEENHSASAVRHHARNAGRKTLLDLMLPHALRGTVDMLSVLKLQSVL